jgi:hypothetical protein
MTEKKERIVVKICPYCGKMFREENGEFFSHLIDFHAEDIDGDFDVFDTVVEENWDDLIDYYEDDIKEVFDSYTDEIMFNFGEETLYDVVDELIRDAEEMEIEGEEDEEMHPL